MLKYVNPDMPQWRPSRDPPFEPGQEIPFDWSVRLSIDQIRQHTKTDDIPGVTDEQLDFLRESALEVAQLYTGMLLTGQRTMVEPIEGPTVVRMNKPFYKHKLKYPVADGIVYLYGGRHPEDNRPFRVEKGTRTIRVPIRYDMLQAECCDPCLNRHMNADMMAAYKAGYACPDDVPSLIILGCLQFIAWVVQHPGDEILTVRNRRDARSEGAMGSNNIAIASGALETWRLVDYDVV